MSSLLLGSSIEKLASSGIRNYRRKLPSATRAALEKTFEYWLKHFAPLHFNRKAFRRYDEYKKNYKRGYTGPGKYNPGSDLARLAGRIKYGKDTGLPLVKTKALRQAFLHGSYRFSGANKDLTTKWTSLPQYAYKYHPNQSRKYVALTEINDQEVMKMVDVFEKFLDIELAKIDKTAKSFGRVVI